MNACKYYVTQLQWQWGVGVAVNRLGPSSPPLPPSLRAETAVCRELILVSGSRRQLLGQIAPIAHKRKDRHPSGRPKPALLHPPDKLRHRRLPQLCISPDEMPSPDPLLDLFRFRALVRWSLNLDLPPTNLQLPPMPNHVHHHAARKLQRKVGLGGHSSGQGLHGRTRLLNGRKAVQLLNPTKVAALWKLSAKAMGSGKVRELLPAVRKSAAAATTGRASGNDSQPPSGNPTPTPGHRP